MKTLVQQRRRDLAACFSDAKIDALLSTNPPNWFYLTGFTGESGALIVSRKGTTLITDGRFMVQGCEEMKGVRLVQQQGSLLGSIGQFLKDERCRRVGFDSTQVTVEQLRSLRKAAGANVGWVATPGRVESLRMRKDAAELAQMRRAANLADQMVQLAIGLLKPGIREFEVAAEIEYQMKKKGASGPAFETIVAFGERSALPHARPTSKQLRKNELVVLDLGAILGHYCSDITRTVYVGRAPKRIRTWYQAVLEAQGAAIAAAKSGAVCMDVDGAARQVLAGYSLDGLFVHSTGHGLGIEVHEDPRVARGQKKRLAPGNVITIEPGVYSAGIGGIRIEDDVAIHAHRTEVLTRAPRDLIEL
ncbi:MAG TPA: Xaa-Pro peptidase family protein [Candidatus Acidoferrum sp.]|nr:Xaa-Pro peptidase family protein [Candidatus Acidoferrum sp.]